MVSVALTAAGSQLCSYNGNADISNAAVTEIHLGDDEFKCLLLLLVLISHRAKSKSTIIFSTRETD